MNAKELTVLMVEPGKHPTMRKLAMLAIWVLGWQVGQGSADWETKPVLVSRWIAGRSP